MVLGVLYGILIPVMIAAWLGTNWPPAQLNFARYSLVGLPVIGLVMCTSGSWAEYAAWFGLLVVLALAHVSRSFEAGHIDWFGIGVVVASIALSYWIAVFLVHEPFKPIAPLIVLAIGSAMTYVPPVRRFMHGVRDRGFPTR